jgi:hypothetical protein
MNHNRIEGGHQVAFSCKECDDAVVDVRGILIEGGRGDFAAENLA